MKSPRWLLPLVLPVLLAGPAAAGSVRTRDGRFLEGTVQLDAGQGVKITLAGGRVERIALANLEVAVFETGAADALPPAAAALMKGTGNGWLGTYFERVDFSGRQFHRLDDTVQFDWENGAPILGVQRDYFSVRWTGELEPPVSGDYIFSLDADDGARLWINRDLVCDAWRVSDGAEVSGRIRLEAGKRCAVRLEYYDNLGPARVRLAWSGPGFPRSVIPKRQLQAALSETGGRSPSAPTNGLLAAYFKRGDLDGSAVTRIDPQLDFSWGEDAPVAEVPAGSFSTRWTGQVRAQFTESHTFHIESSGGARLWLDGQLLLDQWRGRSGEYYSTVVPLTAGQHYDLRIEQFHEGKEARFKLQWSCASQPRAVVPSRALTPAPTTLAAPRVAVSGLLGTYFSRPDCTGEVLKRVDAQVNFDWGNYPPAPGVPAERFSARWSGMVRAEHTENHTFHVETDDGVRVWLNERPIIDEWREQSTTVVSQPVVLNAGQFYPLTIEYFNARPPAWIKLKWSSPSLPLAIIPASRLFPPHAPAAPGGGGEPRIGLARGLLTWDGSFLTAPVTAADDTVVEFGGALREFTLSTVNVARLIFHNISPQRAARLEPGRAGVLLLNGDFVDGDFKGLERGCVKISSVLFGLRMFDASHEVMAVFLRDPVPAPSQFRIRTTDGSQLLARTLQVRDDAVVVQDASLRGFRVAAAELVEIRQGTNLFPKSAALGPDSSHAEAARVVPDPESELRARATASRRLVETENERRARAESEDTRRIRTELEARDQADATARSAARRAETDRDAVRRAETALAQARARSEPPILAAQQAAADLAAKTTASDRARAAADQATAEARRRTMDSTKASARLEQVRQKSAQDRAAAEAEFTAEAGKLDQVTREQTTRVKQAESEHLAAERQAEKQPADKSLTQSATRLRAQWEKAVASMKEAIARAQADRDKAAARRNEIKSATEAEVVAETTRSKQALEARTQADRAVATAAAESNRLLADRNSASARQKSAQSAADASTIEVGNRHRAVLAARAVADKSVAQQEAAERALVTARQVIEKRAQAQFK